MLLAFLAITTSFDGKVCAQGNVSVDLPSGVCLWWVTLMVVACCANTRMPHGMPDLIDSWCRRLRSTANHSAVSNAGALARVLQLCIRRPDILPSQCTDVFVKNRPSKLTCYGSKLAPHGGKSGARVLARSSRSCPSSLSASFCLFAV